MNVIKLIYRNLDQFKTRFVITFIIGVFGGAFSFAIALTLTEFTKGGLSLDRFGYLVGTLIFVYSGYLLTAWGVRRYGEALAAQFENHIRFKYFKRLESLPSERIARLHSGYILSLFNQIGSAINQVLFSTFWSLAASVAHITLFFIFLTKESAGIALVNLVTLVCFVTLSTWLARKMVTVNKELNLKRASLLESYSDFITNIFTIKKLAVYSFAEERLDSKTKDNYDQIRKMQSLHARRWLLLHGLYGATYMGTMIFFLYRVAHGTQSLAILILFVAAYGAVRFHIERLSETLKVIMETKAYIDNVENLLEGTDNNDSAESMTEWQKIYIRNAELTYHENHKRVVIPDFYLEKGEKICIEGVSGQGKSTLLQILVNAYSPQTGHRSVGDTPYESLSRDFFDRTMVIISQEVELFNISLRENITLGQSIPEQKIWDILEALDLAPWIRNLDNGLDTLVGEKGIRLSAGQKQRINLIRGLLLDREIYLLDEPTSHLDMKTEARVVQFLKSYLQDKTAVIVTHRPELRAVCTRNYLFKNHTLNPS